MNIFLCEFLCDILSPNNKEYFNQLFSVLNDKDTPSVTRIHIVSHVSLFFYKNHSDVSI